MSAGSATGTKHDTETENYKKTAEAVRVQKLQEATYQVQWTEPLCVSMCSNIALC